MSISFEIFQEKLILFESPDFKEKHRMFTNCGDEFHFFISDAVDKNFKKFIYIIYVVKNKVFRIYSKKPLPQINDLFSDFKFTVKYIHPDSIYNYLKSILDLQLSIKEKKEIFSSVFDKTKKEKKEIICLGLVLLLFMSLIIFLKKNSFLKNFNKFFEN